MGELVYGLSGLGVGMRGSAPHIDAKLDRKLKKEGCGGGGMPLVYRSGGRMDITDLYAGFSRC